jgi:hypothetical protein
VRLEPLEPISVHARVIHPRLANPRADECADQTIPDPDQRHDTRAHDVSREDDLERIDRALAALVVV